MTILRYDAPLVSQSCVDALVHFASSFIVELVGAETLSALGAQRSNYVRAILHEYNVHDESAVERVVSAVNARV